MFNKSILAAALLTVGAIAGGSAVSAAEIGVQSTWGTSNTAITNGRFEAQSTSASAYAERSRVDVLGYNSYENSSVTEGGVPGQEYVTLDALDAATTDYRGTLSGDGVFGFVDIEALDRDSLVVNEGARTTTSSDTSRGGQVSWARAGRVEFGGSFSTSSDSYDYTGSRSSGFSGITAFTR